MTKISQIRFPRNEFRMMCDAKCDMYIDFTIKSWADDFRTDLIEIIESEGLDEKWQVEMEQFIAKLRPLKVLDFHELVAEIDYFQDKDDEDYRAFFNTLSPIHKVFYITKQRNLDLDYIIKGESPKL